MRCTFPKCVARGGQCVCPNSYIIFTAREQQKRQLQGKPPLSQVALLRRYHGAKRRGTFSWKPDLDPQHQCDADAARLCAWHRQVEHGSHTTQADLSSLYGMSLARVGRAVIAGHVGKGFSQLSGSSLPDTAQKAAHTKLRLPPAVRLHRLLGAGAAGRVYSACARGPTSLRWFAVKEQPLRTKQDVKSFACEVALQNEFAQLSCAVKVDKAWVAVNGDSKTGVMVMAPVDGILGDVIAGNHESTDRRDLVRFYAHVAKEIKRLYQYINSKGLAHGDMHFHNIAIRYLKGRVGQPPADDGRRFPHLVFIDTGRSFRYVQLASAADQKVLEDADRYWVWRAAASYPLLNEALVHVGFPGSYIMREFCGKAKPRPQDLPPTHILDATNWLGDLLLKLQDSTHAQLLPEPTPLPESR